MAIPANGVVYVEGCQTTPVNYVTTSGGTTKCNSQTYNPLSAAGETGSGSDTTGDAIVQGTVNSPMTIGSANNIVIDGNICYADNVSGGTCTAVPAAPSTDVLGLVADNYVEINHPVTPTARRQQREQLLIHPGLGRCPPATCRTRTSTPSSWRSTTRSWSTTTTRGAPSGR